MFLMRKCLCHAVSIFVGQLPNKCIHTMKWITTHFLVFSSFRPTVPIKMYSKFYFFHYLRQHGGEATPTRSFEVQTDPVKLPDVPVKIRKGSRILYPSHRSLGDFMPPFPSSVGQQVWPQLNFLVYRLYRNLFMRRGSNRNTVGIRPLSFNICIVHSRRKGVKKNNIRSSMSQRAWRISWIKRSISLSSTIFSFLRLKAIRRMVLKPTVLRVRASTYVLIFEATSFVIKRVWMERKTSNILDCW